MQPRNTFEEVHGLEGPDYVTLVIEWNDDPDEHDDEVTTVSASPYRAPVPGRTFAMVLGALGAIALTTWGLRHLKPA